MAQENVIKFNSEDTESIANHVEELVKFTKEWLQDLVEAEVLYVNKGKIQINDTKLVQKMIGD